MAHKRIHQMMVPRSREVMRSRLLRAVEPAAPGDAAVVCAGRTDVSLGTEGHAFSTGS